MVSKAEIFGRALGKAVKQTVAGRKPAEPAPVLYRVNIADVPPSPLEAGAPGTQVQVLIDRMTAGAGHMVGRSVVKSGARQAMHRYVNCDAFLMLLQGGGMIDTGAGDMPAHEGDVIFLPRGCWHGLNNTSNTDAVLLWGLLGAGSLEDSGYQVHPAARSTE